MPLVVIVGQQDRRHLASRPFLAGDLDGLAGAYPVWTSSPGAPAGRPGRAGPCVPRGPDRPGPGGRRRAQRRLGRTRRPPRPPEPGRRAPRPGSRTRARWPSWPGWSRPPAGRRSSSGPTPTAPAAWEALVGLAEHLVAPVWQEAFAARAGFPQDHRLLRRPPAPGPRDAPLGARRARPGARGRRAGVPPVPVLARRAGGAGHDDRARQRRRRGRPPQPRRPGPARRPGAVTVRALTAALPRGSGGPPLPSDGCNRRSTPIRRHRLIGETPEPGDAPLNPPTVFTELAARLPADAVVVEETPSSRPGPAPARPGPGAAGVPVRGARAGWASGCPRRSACGWARRRGRSWRSWATARRSTGCRRSGRRRTTASACSCSSWTTAATRSWTGSRRRPVARRRGRGSPRSTWPGSRRRWAARRSGWARTGS